MLIGPWDRRAIRSSPVQLILQLFCPHLGIGQGQGRRGRGNGHCWRRCIGKQAPQNARRHGGLHRGAESAWDFEGDHVVSWSVDSTPGLLLFL